MTRYSAVVQLIAQRWDPHRKIWAVLKTEALGDLFLASTWMKYFPLRLNVIGRNKAGVAENVEQFKALLEAIGVRPDVPYAVAKGAEHGYNGRPRGASRNAKDPWGWLTEKQGV